jgi:hypothetical protein
MTWESVLMTALLMMMSVATAAECGALEPDCVEFEVVTTQPAGVPAGSASAEYRYELELDQALADDICAAATAGDRVYVEWEWSYSIAASPFGAHTAYAAVDAQSQVRFWRPGVYDRLKQSYSYFDEVFALPSVADVVAWEFDITQSQACGAQADDTIVVLLGGEVEAAASPGGGAPTSPASASASMSDIAVLGITGSVTLRY